MANGTTCTCIIQNPTDAKGNFTGVRFEGYDGLYSKTLIVHVKKADLPEIPPEGQPFTVDGEVLLVNTVIDDMGMLSITLTGNMRGY
ncbi:MAG: hypothetical protein IJ849_02300 [Selenomonadaceae bacterium]|nr:hypothetical protein [Selenomonadaceae bacterium]